MEWRETGKINPFTQTLTKPCNSPALEEPRFSRMDALPEQRFHLNSLWETTPGLEGKSEQTRSADAYESCKCNRNGAVVYNGRNVAIMMLMCMCRRGNIVISAGGGGGITAAARLMGDQM